MRPRDGSGAQARRDALLGVAQGGAGPVSGQAALDPGQVPRARGGQAGPRGPGGGRSLTARLRDALGRPPARTRRAARDAAVSQAPPQVAAEQDSAGQEPILQDQEPVPQVQVLPEEERQAARGAAGSQAAPQRPAVEQPEVAVEQQSADQEQVQVQVLEEGQAARDADVSQAAPQEQVLPEEGRAARGRVPGLGLVAVDGGAGRGAVAADGSFRGAGERLGGDGPPGGDVATARADRLAGLAPGRGGAVAGDAGPDGQGGAGPRGPGRALRSPLAGRRFGSGPVTLGGGVAGAGRAQVLQGQAPSEEEWRAARDPAGSGRLYPRGVRPLGPPASADDQVTGAGGVRAQVLQEVDRQVAAEQLGADEGRGPQRRVLEVRRLAMAVRRLAENIAFQRGWQIGSRRPEGRRVGPEEPREDRLGRLLDEMRVAWRGLGEVMAQEPAGLSGLAGPVLAAAITLERSAAAVAVSSGLDPAGPAGLVEVDTAIGQLRSTARELDERYRAPWPGSGGAGGRGAVDRDPAASAAACGRGCAGDHAGDRRGGEGG